MSCQDVGEENKRYVILWSHFHTSCLPRKSLAHPGLSSYPRQVTDESPCSWWQGPLMSSNFLCSFPALLEGLGIILLLLCSARARESWQGHFWADLLHHRQHFFLRAPAAFMLRSWLAHWDYKLGNLGPGLLLGPTNTSAFLSIPLLLPNRPEKLSLLT